MVIEYKQKEEHPPRKEIIRDHMKQKVIRLAICVDIKPYLTSRNVSDVAMSEIEKVTNKALEDSLASVYMNHQGRIFRVDYTLEP